jgi:hypothetical protein
MPVYFRFSKVCIAATVVCLSVFSIWMNLRTIASKFHLPAEIKSDLFFLEAAYNEHPPLYRQDRRQAYKAAPRQTKSSHVDQHEGHEQERSTPQLPPRQDAHGAQTSQHAQHRDDEHDDSPDTRPSPNSEAEALSYLEDLDKASFQQVCLTKECLMAEGRKLARAFTPVPRQQWCIPFDNPQTPLSYNNATQEWQSLLLVKVPKAASSTMAGVVLRLANETGCSVQWEHHHGDYYANRSASSLLIGSIREPISRSLSALWFFTFTPSGKANPSDERVLRGLRTEKGGESYGRGGYQYDWLSTEPVTRKSVTSKVYPGLVRNPHMLLSKLRDLMSQYHFMVVAERMDESLVAFSFVAGVSLSDVMVTSSKVSGQGSTISIYQAVSRV